MTIEEVREFAAEHGIMSLNKFDRKDDLIRVVQLAMGGDSCFGPSSKCANGFCLWMDECPSRTKNGEEYHGPHEKRHNV
jgi:hypothetical protein